MDIAFFLTQPQYSNLRKHPVVLVAHGGKISIMLSQAEDLNQIHFKLFLFF